jgi:hypothetical protein
MRGLLKPGALATNPGVRGFSGGENMTKHYPFWRFCSLLVMLSCTSVGHAQDASHKILKKVPVQYPKALKEKGIQGDVRLKVFIKADGSVKNTELLGGNPILAESAKNQSVNGSSLRAIPKQHWISSCTSTPPPTKNPRGRSSRENASLMDGRCD